MDKNIRYNEPWILQRADPYVCRHTDGFYYFTASLPEYDGIALRRSRTLQGLSDAEEIRIWNRHESGIMSFHIWAPELHYLDGKWYVYFAGSDKDDIWELRPGNNRVLFFYHKDDTYVLLHHFRTKTQKTPPREIERAKSERDDWISRKG